VTFETDEVDEVAFGALDELARRAFQYSYAAWPYACTAAPTYPLSRQVSRAQDTKPGDWLR
jgi:hypothetical protein